MHTDSIFEENDILPKASKPIFKVVGILRIIYCFLILSATAITLYGIVILLLFTNTSEYTSVSETTQKIIPKFFTLVFYFFLLLYNIPQTKKEITKSPFVAGKQKYRGYNIVFNAFIFIISLVTFIYNSSIFGNFSVLMLSIFFISLLLVACLLYADIYYYRSKKINPTAHS